MLVVPAAAPAAGTLHAVALPSPGSGAGVGWVAVNDSDQVAGTVATGPTAPRLPARWQNGVTTTMTDLGGVPSPDAEITAIDDAGRLFGSINNGAAKPQTASEYPAIWSPSGTVTKLPPGIPSTELLAASDTGNTVGHSTQPTNDYDLFYALAPSYAYTPLPGLLALGDPSGLAINDAGHIATEPVYVDNGNGTGGTTKPYLVVNGSPRPLNVVITNGFELNNHDDVAGSQLTGDGGAAIEHANGTMQPLPPLHPGDRASVVALNDSDEAVGASVNNTSGTSVPVAWIGGKVVTIASLIAPGFTGTITSVHDINNNGSIFAYGTSANGGFQEYLLEAGGATVIGRATSRDGKSLSGAKLRLTGTTDTGTLVSKDLVTGPTGAYSTAVDPGRYTVTPAGDPPDQSGGKWDASACDGTPNVRTGACALNHLAAGGQATASFLYTPCGAAEDATSEAPATGCPIVFIPGFLGTRITCRGQELWPGLPHSDFADLVLEPDGLTNTRGPCSGVAAPVPDESGLVTNVGPSDVYGKALDFLRDIAGPGRTFVYTYDWRKSPEVATAGLDKTVDSAMTITGADRVVLMAHSMGGLVTRAYLDDQAHADKVVRVLTLGTPYWGSPKAHFMLLQGDTDTPEGGVLDNIVTRSALQAFARTTSGGYWLYPSARYGRWLDVSSEGGQLREAGVDRWVEALGGASAVLDQARRGHARLDGFKAGKVDYQVMVGVGVPTVRWVTITDPLGRPAFASLRFGSGDGTVPGVSATQGAITGGPPLGDDVPIHYACGITHLGLPADPGVQGRIKDFLLKGAAIPDSPGDNCPYSGDQISVVGLLHLATQASVATAAGSLTVTQARQKGLIDVVTIGDRTTIVTNHRHPVRLQLTGRALDVEVQSLSSHGAGPTRFYGPVRGPLTVGAAGALTRKGHKLKAGHADHTPPRTVARVVRRGHRFVVRLHAHDRAGVAATYVRIGKAKSSVYRHPLKLSARQLTRLRFASVDRFGNLERTRRARRPPKRHR